jgi:hypothetical protein
MKKKIFIVLFSSIIFNGCSIAGYLIGDYYTNDSLTSESSEIIKIDSGQTVTVKLIDQNEIEGEFLGFSKIPYEEYLSKLNSDFELINKSFLIPKLGDELFSKQLLNYSMCFIHQNNRDYEIEKILMLKPKFFGFGFYGFLFSSSSYENADIIPASYFYENEILQSFEQTYDLQKVLLLFMQKRFSNATNLLLEVNGKKILINSNEIEKITKNEFPTNAFVGLAIGLGLDALIIYGISNGASTGFNVFKSKMKF